MLSKNRAPTPFELRVYKLCSQIPRGKVSTYKEIANALGCKAYRAVGQALNKNPFAPQIPCHRVVASNGTIGGFAHGEKAKISLLKKEGITICACSVQDFKRVCHKFRILHSQH